MKKLFLILILIIMSGCFLIQEEKKEEEKKEFKKQIYLSEDKKIEYKNEEIDIYDEEETENSIKRAPKGKKVVDFEYEIKLIARIKPVNVSGENVQANDIILKSNDGIISYNYAKEKFKGAIQVVNFKDFDNDKVEDPYVESEIKFENIDINCLFLDGNTLYFGGAANPDIYPQGKSVLGKINNYKSIDINDIENNLKFIDRSHGVTAITKKGSDLYVSIGAKDGAILVYDKDLNELKVIDKADVRDMEEYKDGIIVLKGTTDNTGDGEILFIKSQEIEKQIKIVGFDSDYNKATIEMYNKELAFTGLSKAGFKIYNIKDDENPEVIFDFPNPDDNTLHVTNSVSFENKLAFVSNGEYGFRILNILDLSKKNSELANKIGYYPYEGLKDESGQNYSANHIQYRSKKLFVASGVGGVMIFYINDK